MSNAMYDCHEISNAMYSCYEISSVMYACNEMFNAMYTCHNISNVMYVCLEISNLMYAYQRRYTFIVCIIIILLCHTRHYPWHSHCVMQSTFDLTAWRQSITQWRGNLYSLTSNTNCKYIIQIQCNTVIHYDYLIRHYYKQQLLSATAPGVWNVSVAQAGARDNRWTRVPRRFQIKALHKKIRDPGIGSHGV